MSCGAALYRAQQHTVHEAANPQEQHLLPLHSWNQSWIQNGMLEVVSEQIHLASEQPGKQKLLLILEQMEITV